MADAAGGVLGTWGGLWYWGPLGQVEGARQWLGAALVVYGLWGWCGYAFNLPQRAQGGWGAVVGLATGAITAVTGVFVVPAVAYLQALQLPRAALMQAMGLSFSVSTLALAVGMGGLAGDSRVLDGAALAASAAMLVPALLGMALGERLRARLPAAAFKRGLMGGLLALGVYMLCA